VISQHEAHGGSGSGFVVIHQNDKLLRTWAIAAIALIAITYAIPTPILALLEPNTNLLVRILTAATLFIGVFGFYFRMFFECATSREVHSRGSWMLLFIFLPVFSAFVYFFVTRSKRYKDGKTGGKNEA
jgi:hypothetical protein